MTIKTTRKIVHIDEDKCTGCGICIPSCAEGALQIIDGKAKLVSEKFCDGLGACLGKCPEDAITVEERVADGFDEELVKEHLASHQQVEETLPCGCPGSSVVQFEERTATATPQAETDNLPCGCPGSTVAQFDERTATVVPESDIPQQSMLRHWPVQMTLVPPRAPFLQGTDLLLTAQCVPFTYAGFHQDFLRDHSLLIACPKLDDFQAHLRKLTDILSQSDIRSLTVVRMEVPCCSGLVHMAQKAIEASGKNIPLREVTIGVRGEVLA
ncbi:MAG TPA: 4Fe-4S binding protein [Dehalococcoidia bacterium]|nr:4Fe-4S binding protein [Dehalococcoidia bacterium]